MLGHSSDWFFPCRLQNHWGMLYSGGGLFQLTTQTWVNLHWRPSQPLSRFSLPRVPDQRLSLSNRSSMSLQFEVMSHTWWIGLNSFPWTVAAIYSPETLHQVYPSCSGYTAWRGEGFLHVLSIFKVLPSPLFKSYLFVLLFHYVSGLKRSRESQLSPVFGRDFWQDFSYCKGDIKMPSSDLIFCVNCSLMTFWLC